MPNLDHTQAHFATISAVLVKLDKTRIRRPPNQFDKVKNSIRLYFNWIRVAFEIRLNSEPVMAGCDTMTAGATLGKVVFDNLLKPVQTITCLTPSCRSRAARHHNIVSVRHTSGSKTPRRTKLQTITNANNAARTVG